jgi:hypothetical protein
VLSVNSDLLPLSHENSNGKLTITLQKNRMSKLMNFALLSELINLFDIEYLDTTLVFVQGMLP